MPAIKSWKFSTWDKLSLLCAEKNPSVEIQLNCDEEKRLVFLNKSSGLWIDELL